MIAELPAKDVTWLSCFFSGRNALKWQEVVDGSAPAAWLELVVPWINSIADGERNTPIVLPVFDKDGPSRWYAMAEDDASSVALAQELLAYIGPSFSDFRGLPLQVDFGDEIERSLSDRFGRHIFRLAPNGPTVGRDVSQAVQLYLSVLRRRPSVRDRTQRPFGRIRSDFDCALLAGNEKDAYRFRQEMIDCGRLDAEQQKYLEIRLLAGLGRRHQVAHDFSLLRSVLGLSLPAQTLVDVVDALYATHISEIESGKDTDDVIAVFEREIARPFGAFFAERKGVVQTNVLKAFFLNEIAKSEPDAERCEAIASACASQDGRDLIEKWASRLKPLTEVKEATYESVRQALGDEDYELALEAAFKCLPEGWAYNAVLRCAIELRDVAISRRVIGAMESAPDSVRSSLSERDSERLQILQKGLSVPDLGAEMQASKPVSDWLSWIDYVERGSYEVSPIQVLREAVCRWSFEAYASDPEHCRVLAGRIGNASGKAEGIFREAFPELVEFFIDQPSRPTRAFIPLYLTQIRILAWSGTVSANELELASVVLQSLLGLGPSREDYCEVVELFGEIVRANGSSGNIDWALNAAEMLAVSSSPDSEERLRFFMDVVALIKAHIHRIKASQYEVLSLLEKDYGCSGLLDSAASGDGGASFAAANPAFNGLVGIYTLTETAGQRARELLRKILPLARIEINSDLVATEKLKNLARAADIFVFAWKSSKHQAYYAAKEARGDLPMLLPLGKGSASILDCILRQLDERE